MLTSLNLPLFRELDAAQRILLAGAGGGFDMFSALPLYFALRDAGKIVSLANVTFSSMNASTGRRLTPACIEITADSLGSEVYFPEKHLAVYLANEGHPSPIYALERTGCIPLRHAYHALLDLLHFDTLLLVDGGTDSLMRGDESDLGTPEEDLASIAATHDLPIPRKLFAAVGFGIDTYHGIAHDFVLQAIADITLTGGYLGAFSLTPDMPAVHHFRRATEYVLKHTPDFPSIVATSILAAIDGRFGNYHPTTRTAGSTLYINPLMAIVWSFQLDALAQRLLMLDTLKSTRTYNDLTRAITAFRIRTPIRPKRSIPL